MHELTITKGSQTIKTYTDWGLVPKTRFNVAPAEPKYNYIEVEGSDAIIDLTESLTGYVCYNMRSCEITFTIIRDRKAWSSIYSDIMNFIQGEKVMVFSDEDPEWYWIGRFQVSDWDTAQKTGEITISGKVEPYKIFTHEPNENWLWDNFNFEIGVIRDSNFEFQTDVGETDTVYPLTVLGSKKHVIPTITYLKLAGVGEVYLMKNPNSYVGQQLLTEDDESRFPDYVLGDGEHVMYFHVVCDGTTTLKGRITVNYEVGSL